jgi:hypothetical protein
MPGAEFLSLLGSAMPALRHVTVNTNGGDIGSDGLFNGLQLCRQLSTLHLEEFTIGRAAVKPAAAALAQLPALRELSIYTRGRDLAGLVEQLTCLTALDLSAEQRDEDDTAIPRALATAARNPALQAFKLSPGNDFQPDAADLQHLLEACPALSDLDLESATPCRLMRWRCSSRAAPASLPCQLRSLQLRSAWQTGRAHGSA